MSKGLRLTEAEAKKLGIGQGEPDHDATTLTAKQVADHIHRNYKRGYQHGFAEQAKSHQFICALFLLAGFLAGFTIALIVVHRL